MATTSNYGSIAQESNACLTSRHDLNGQFYCLKNYEACPVHLSRVTGGGKENNSTKEVDTRAALGEREQQNAPKTIRPAYLKKRNNHQSRHEHVNHTAGLRHWFVLVFRVHGGQGCSSVAHESNCVLCP